MPDQPTGSERRLRAAAIALTFWNIAANAQVSPEFLTKNAELIESRDVALELHKDGPITRAEAAILVAAGPQAIWDILVACEIAPQYVPNVVACSSLEVLDDGAAELFIQTVKPAFFIPSFEHVFRMDYKHYERIIITRASGPIRHLESAWILNVRDDGNVLVEYSLAVDPGIPIPRLFVRQTLRRDLPKVLAAVRERAETPQHDF
jgi:ribosome-associated toxin RatA of RatAB toxin-antitoxin module